MGPDIEDALGGQRGVGSAAVFASGCAGCHTLAAAGSSGTTGPDLDKALTGKDEAYIETSIVDPSAKVASRVLARDHARDLR